MATGGSSEALDMASVFIHTTETVRIQYILNLLIKNGHHCMLVGGHGTGKTSIIKDVLQRLDSELYATKMLPLNYFHDGPALQNCLESVLERKIGSTWGPPGNKKLVYCFDDLNIPLKDKYETQTALELLRQGIDSKGWFDKIKGTAKDVAGIQFVAAMNPTAGSFTISPRVQRHFCTVFVPMPAPHTISSMFGELVNAHMSGPGWIEEKSLRLGQRLVDATVDLHKAVVQSFVPSAVRFQYVFSLREVAAVVHGLLRMTPAVYNSSSSITGVKACRLWAHECERVYADRLIDESDMAVFHQLRVAVAKRHFTDIISSYEKQHAAASATKFSWLNAQTASHDVHVHVQQHTQRQGHPLLFTSFVSTLQSTSMNALSATTAAAAQASFQQQQQSHEQLSSCYDDVPSHDVLRHALESRLAEHNETNLSMDLVLFPQAAEHVVRIARVLDVPGGHVMMVGYGGNGKQSLSRLAAYVAGCETFQIQVTTEYSVADFKADILKIYQKCVIKSLRVMFLITDAHIVDERFLLYINEILTTGCIADIIPVEEKDALCSAVKAEIKAEGGLDTPEMCWQRVITKIRRSLHVIMCCSPVGESLRSRARRFPALVGCCTYNWIRPWPMDALESVAERFLKDAIMAYHSPANGSVSPTALARFMASVHRAVDTACTIYAERYKRHNYVTPKSYLELISIYKSILHKSSHEMRAARERLERGVEKIASASSAVVMLQESLVKEKIIVEEKKATTQSLIESIGREKASTDEAVASSKTEEDAAAALAKQVTAVQTDCAADLARAEPIIAAAEAALNSLDKSSLGELKSFSNPAPEVVAVVSACMILTASAGAMPRDVSWSAGKKWMGSQSLDQFLKSLLTFDKDNVPQQCVDRVEQEYLSLPTFRPEVIRVKSVAAAGLAAWVTNICKYFRIYQVVAPKRIALAEANRKLVEANRKLTGVRAKVAELRSKVAALEASLAAATAEKVAAMAQAERTAAKAALADRLINGLSSEFTRWSTSIEEIKKKEGKLIVDALFAAAFVSYAAAFNDSLRKHLIHECWVPEAINCGILCSLPSSTAASWHPLDLLTPSTSKAVWNREGLPTDGCSAENATVIACTKRWPLLIDPQLQGVKWIKNKERENGLVVLQQGQLTLASTARKFFDTLIRAVEDGTPVLIENLPESIDSSLESLIARQTIRRGKTYMISLGGKEVVFNPDFRLYLHTKLPNPHYGPEIAAQTTLVNFSVTPEGLEEQLLSAVVGHEAADVQEKAAKLDAQLARYAVTLQQLEDDLLARLASSHGDILEDSSLVESLESTKRIASTVAAEVAKAKETEAMLATTRELYRSVASRGALLYFFTESLSVLDRVYWFSMANFMEVLKRGMDATPLSSTIQQRVSNMIHSITEMVFAYVVRGVFERHKPIIAAHLCFLIQSQQGKLSKAELDYFLSHNTISTSSPSSSSSSSSSFSTSSSSAAAAAAKPNPLAEVLPESSWMNVVSLSQNSPTMSTWVGKDRFSGLSADLEASSKRWKDWLLSSQPEEDPLPGDWKKVSPFDKALIVRVLRPDRTVQAVSYYVSSVLGPSCAALSRRSLNLEAAMLDAGPQKPVLMFITTGVDAASPVEELAKKKGRTVVNGGFASVSLGQGQENLALSMLQRAAISGGWVLLQNIHLTMEWTWAELDKIIDMLSTTASTEGTTPLLCTTNNMSNNTNRSSTTTSTTSVVAPSHCCNKNQKDSNTHSRVIISTLHPDFQLFLSAEPPPSLEKPLPPSLLQTCVKITNEPPQGLRANFLRAWSQFDDETLDSCARQTEYKAMVFALCFFHAALQERKKFGVGNVPGSKSAIGWNMSYPFSGGDLRCCAQLIANYLDASAKIPWEDIRYMVGEIMYGGHVVELWDRRLVDSYLSTILSPSLLEEGKVCSGLSVPPSTMSHEQVLKYIEDHLPLESSSLIGMNHAAEVGVAIRCAEELTAGLVSMQQSTQCVVVAKDASEGGGGHDTRGPARAAAIGHQDSAEEKVQGIVQWITESLPSDINIEDLRHAAIAKSTTDTALSSSPPPAVLGTSSGSASNTKGAPLQQQHTQSDAPVICIPPFAMVVIQEAERMNSLLKEIRTSLSELSLGLRGDLVMSPKMEELMRALTGARVPSTWGAVSFASLRPLHSWVKNVCMRHAHLMDWAQADPTSIPPSVWLSGLFNPASFLTAVLQVAARKAGWALDATTLLIDVTKKSFATVDSPPREGAYIHGLWLEGALWSDKNQCLEDLSPTCGSSNGSSNGTNNSNTSVTSSTMTDPSSKHGQGQSMLSQMPVLHIKAVPSDKNSSILSSKDFYPCPVYTTESRFRQEVMTVYLKCGKRSPAYWATAGVALVLDAVHHGRSGSSSSS